MSAEPHRERRTEPSHAVAQGTNVWEFLYSAGLLQTPAILVYIEYVIAVCQCLAIPVFQQDYLQMPPILVHIEHAIAVYKCMAIPLFGPTVYKCQQFLYTSSV